MVRIGPVVSEEKMLTHDARRTTDDDGRQPIAIGHLSDSGDLKIAPIESGGGVSKRHFHNEQQFEGKKFISWYIKKTHEF